VENIAYKTADHAFRSADAYAQGKYDVTTRWLGRARPGQRLLNIGCGGGEYNATAHALGYDVIACEPEAGAYELAVLRSPCEVRHCGLLELEVEPADAIVMHDVLEHIEDDAGAVAKLHALLAPNGVAVISVPAYQWLFGHHDVQLGHYRRYTRRKLVSLFEGVFDVEASRYYGAALIPVALWFSRIRKKAYPIASASRGVGHAALQAICRLESRIAMPVGTSVLVRVRRAR
jgi:2-polyprenyl-3-methyl-5-hydroxy-6-metoxy-1,4-benzoquinol methylase